MKNKNVQILEIDTFWPLRDKKKSVDLVPSNESTHHNPFNGGKSHQYWKKNGNSLYIHFKHAKFLNLEGGLGGSMSVGSWITKCTQQLIQAYYQYGMGSCPAL